MAATVNPALKALGLTREEMIAAFNSEYGKGAYHAEALFRHLYARGSAMVGDLPEYLPAASLASRVEKDYRIVLPPQDAVQDDGGTRKYTLVMADGSRTESVIIPMTDWNTLCISSQVGCRRGCAFCETARMGLIRNLHASEIVAQWAFARFSLGVPPRNIVYMGMGEPFDNFDQVIRSIRILSDPRGAGIPKRRISVSTCGHVEGIHRLTAMETEFPGEAWRTVHLAVSLNAPDDERRNRLMPVNRLWPMSELREALLNAPQSSIKDALYFEYVVIPGVNSSVEDAGMLADFMEGMTAKVNIIPYHPGPERRWEAPDDETMNQFHSAVRSRGIECRTRRSRGKGIEAACGMLGGKKGNGDCG